MSLALITWFKGLIIGFAMSAPVGPIGLLCIQRTLSYGLLTGFIAGLGAATADALLGGMAGFGLTFIGGFITGHQRILRFLGGLFLIYLGIHIFRSTPAHHAAQAQRRGLWGTYLSTLLLTISNPMTIIAYTAVFSGFADIESMESTSLILSLIGGIFLGSALWWFILSFGMSLVRTRLTYRTIEHINKTSAVVIIALGIIVLFTLLPFK